MHQRQRACLLASALTVAVLLGCQVGTSRLAASPAVSPRVVTRNVEASDYAGSASCLRCHADVCRELDRSPMHRMTRAVDGADVHAPFAGETLQLGDDRATLETHGSERFVRVDSGASSLLYRVTRVLGGHHREDFVGVRVDDATSPLEPTFADGDEEVLPVSYLIGRKRLRYKGYSVMVRERTHMAAGPVWNRTCLFCHNTVPLLSTLMGALAPRAPGYQGEVVDRRLPEDRAFRYRAIDPLGLEAALSREEERLGEPPHGALGVDGSLRRAIETTRRRFTGSKLLEVGIGCEACHGGCREHVVDPTVRPSMLPTAPYLDVFRSDTTAAEIEDHACARCHQVLFSRYPWTWEGGRRDALAGGSHINSGEGRDMLLGGCQGALRCTACHDPHASEDSSARASLEARSNEACLGCHAALRPLDARRAHSHHDPAGAGGSCVACHMPKKNMSLDGGLTRYHRIGSPTDPARVLGDRPIECALCHAEKTALALVTTMESWWSKRYDRDVLSRAYGDLSAPIMRSTLVRGKPHEKAVALVILGQRKERDAGPLFAAELRDPYPLLRQYAGDALRATYGDDCDIDLGRDPASIDLALDRCGRAAGWSIKTPAAPASAEGDREPVED